MKKTAVLLLAALLAAGRAFAQTTMTVETSVTEGTVTVSGQCGAKGEYVYFQLLKPGTRAEDMNDDTVHDILFFTEDTLAGENGDYSFKFGLYDGVSGDYVFRVRARNDSAYTEKTVNIISVKEVGEIIDAVNGAPSVNGIKTAFDGRDVYAAFSVDPWLVAQCSGFDLLYSKLYEEKTKASFQISELGRLKDVIWEGLIVSAVNAQSDPHGVMDKYAHLIGHLSGTAARAVYDNYLDGETQKAVYASFKSGGFTAYEDVREAFIAEVFRRAVRTCRWQMLKSIIDAYTAYLDGADMSGYTALSDKYGAAEKVCGKTYPRYSDFTIAFNNAVARQREKESGSGASGGTGKGSSAKGAFGGVSAETFAAAAEIEKTEAPEFVDLRGAEWAGEAIKHLAQRRIISGRSAGLFAPDEDMTREEFIKVLVGVLEIYDESARCAFSDITETDWFYPYVASAVGAGLVNGVAADVFGVGARMTRQDMCLIIYRAVKDKIPVKSSDGLALEFTDAAEISPYARDAVTVLTHAKIINGMGNNIFSPKENLTRAQAAKVIYDVTK